MLSGPKCTPICSLLLVEDAAVVPLHTFLIMALSVIVGFALAVSIILRWGTAPIFRTHSYIGLGLLCVYRIYKREYFLTCGTHCHKMWRRRPAWIHLKRGWKDRWRKSPSQVVMGMCNLLVLDVVSRCLKEHSIWSDLRPVPLPCTDIWRQHLSKDLSKYDVCLNLLSLEIFSLLHLQFICVGFKKHGFKS